MVPPKERAPRGISIVSRRVKRDNIQLAHGSGGQAMQQLINSCLWKPLPTRGWQSRKIRHVLSGAAGSGRRPSGVLHRQLRLDPLFFPGGNIGKLAICGTAMTLRSVALFRAISPVALSSKRIADGDTESRSDQHGRNRPPAGIAIVTGDTKVVQRGAADNCLSTPLAWAQFRRIFTGAQDANRRRCIAG